MTIEIAAERLGWKRGGPRRVRRWATRLGYRREGRDWHLTDKQVQAVRVAAERGRAAPPPRGGPPRASPPPRRLP